MYNYNGFDHLNYIIESYNTPILEAFKNEKQERDFKKAKDDFDRYADSRGVDRRDRRGLWQCFLDWKDDHPVMFFLLLASLGLIAYSAHMSRMDAITNAMNTQAFSAIAIVNKIR